MQLRDLLRARMRVFVEPCSGPDVDGWLTSLVLPVCALSPSQGDHVYVVLSIDTPRRRVLLVREKVGRAVSECVCVDPAWPPGPHPA